MPAFLKNLPLRSWLNDVLGSDVLRPGSSTDIFWTEDQDYRYYDIRVDLDNGNYWTFTDGYDLNWHASDVYLGRGVYRHFLTVRQTFYGVVDLSRVQCNDSNPDGEMHLEGLGHEFTTKFTDYHPGSQWWWHYEYRTFN